MREDGLGAEVEPCVQERAACRSRDPRRLIGLLQLSPREPVPSDAIGVHEGHAGPARSDRPLVQGGLAGAVRTDDQIEAAHRRRRLPSGALSMRLPSSSSDTVVWLAVRAAPPKRSVERRVGRGAVMTFRSRLAASLKKKK